MPSDPWRTLEQLPEAALRVLERRWDENQLTDAQCMLMHRLRVRLGDGTAVLVDRLWREVPPIPHGELIDIEPPLRAAAAYTSQDADTFVQNIVAQLVERGLEIHRT